MRSMLRAGGSVLVLGLLGIALHAMSVAAAPVAYVPNDFDNTVSVIDTASNTVVATVPVGDGPNAVAITPDGTHAYVANVVDNTVSVIDTATNTVVATVPVELSPFGVAITPDGTRAYVGSGSVLVIDTATNTVVATVPGGSSPSAVAIAPDGAHAYVTNAPGTADSGSVLVIDTATNTVVVSVLVARTPLGVAITPDGTRAYVTHLTPGTVSVIDTATNTVVASVPVGRGPIGVAITPTLFPTSCLGTGANRLRGRVRTAMDRTGIPDVTVTLTGPSGCQDTTTTNASGHYRFRTLGSGTYTVTPEKDRCTFTPPKPNGDSGEGRPPGQFSRNVSGLGVGSG